MCYLVDHLVHRRYLDYLELREYFARPELPKIDAPRFEALDSQLAALLAREARHELDAEGARQIVELRRVLLRD